MHIQSGTISVENQKLHCLRIGSGPKLLLAFHGFDNKADIFIPLASELADLYTTICIDLPGHGRSAWHLAYFEKKHLMALVQGFKTDLGVDRLSLLGYSLGGRVCLNVVEQQPDWIEELFLLAADGVQRNIWYYLATQNAIGKRLFRYMCNQPEKVLRKFTWLRDMKLVDESRYKFATTKLQNNQIRSLIAYVWPVMSKLMPDRVRVKNNINRYKIKVRLLSGKYDRIFPPERSKKFLFALRNTEHHIIDAGHNFTEKNTMIEIAHIIRQSQ
jgi:pimeloyl-ACP methyl ester carboxylesterase